MENWPGSVFGLRMDQLFTEASAKMKGTVMECCRSSSRKQKKYKRNISTKTSVFFRKVLTKEFPVTRGKYEKKQNWYSVKGWLECLVEIWTKQLLKPFPPDSSFAGYILRTDFDLETGNSLFIGILFYNIKLTGMIYKDFPFRVFVSTEENKLWITIT